MLSIARKTALSGSAARIAQRTLIKPMVLVPNRQTRQYTTGSATAEKVRKKKIIILNLKIRFSNLG